MFAYTRHGGTSGGTGREGKASRDTEDSENSLVELALGYDVLAFHEHLRYHLRGARRSLEVRQEVSPQDFWELKQKRFPGPFGGFDVAGADDSPPPSPP